jgi:hypothetical protein
MWDLIEDKYSEEYKIGSSRKNKQVIILQSCIEYLIVIFLFIIQSILFLSLLPPKEIKKK